MKSKTSKQTTVVLTCILSLLSALLLGSCVMAAKKIRSSRSNPQQDEMVRVNFQTLDTNKDQVLSSKEFAKSRIFQESADPVRAFNFADENGDGYVSKEEFALAFEKLEKMKSGRRR
jgi:Ca2+-binding EF-hand superfamily protein